MSANRIVSRLLPMIALSLPAVGCGEGLPTEPAPDVRTTLAVVANDRVDQGQAVHALPFRLTAGAILVSQDFAPGFGPPTFGKSDFGGRCSMPSDFLIRFALKGEATHLGQFGGVAEHCTRVDFATGGFTIIDGVLTYTAANGDELWDRYSGVGSLGGASGSTVETHTFVGGTGRFLGATGGGTGHPDCDQAAGTCHFELDGTIAYDASAERSH